MSNQSQVQIARKLDKIERELAKVLKMMEGSGLKDRYPPESGFRKSFIKRAEKSLRMLKEGKLKMHTYKSFADFDRSLG
ncbi:MAG: hypothetical protein M1286_02940 [Candidatus Marsarchaeota archaeon]|nr:hypothetical protein [Candidatus Marsarchaeota archaeon]